MPERSNEEIVRRYVQAHAANDFDTLSELRHPEWTAEWPQSGERVRGDANARDLIDHYPGSSLPVFNAGRIVGSEDRWVTTPMYRIFAHVHRIYRPTAVNINHLVDVPGAPLPQDRNVVEPTTKGERHGNNSQRRHGPSSAGRPVEPRRCLRDRDVGRSRPRRPRSRRDRCGTGPHDRGAR